METNNKTNLEYWETSLKDPLPLYKKWYSKEKEFLRENIPKNAKVLDVGCGNGRSLKDIEDVSNSLFGIDHDIKAIESANKLFENNNEIKFIQGDAKEMPFEENSFDFAICMGTFANLGENKVPILKEMKRIIKENGSIIISVYSENAFEERMKLYNRHECPITKIEGTTVYFHESLGDDVSEQFTLDELKEIFNQAGLKIKKHEETEIAHICMLTK